MGGEEWTEHRGFHLGQNQAISSAKEIVSQISFLRELSHFSKTKHRRIRQLRTWHLQLCFPGLLSILTQCQVPKCSWNYMPLTLTNSWHLKYRDLHWLRHFKCHLWTKPSAIAKFVMHPSIDSKCHKFARLEMKCRWQILDSRMRLRMWVEI